MFKVIAYLNSPIILSPDAHLTLDSVLHHALTDKLNGDSEKAFASIPLNRVGSVFAGSSAFFPQDEAHYDYVTRIAGLKGDADAGTHLFKTNDRKRGWRPFQTVRDVDGVKSTMDNYQAIATPYLFWYANGDHYMINELLSGLIGLGKRFSSGNGQIDHVAIEQTDDDYSLVLPDGSPARPIPVTEWTGNVDGLRQESVTCIPPYFSSPRIQCVMHNQRFLKA